MHISEVNVTILSIHRGLIGSMGISDEVRRVRILEKKLTELGGERGGGNRC